MEQASAASSRIAGVALISVVIYPAIVYLVVSAYLAVMTRAMTTSPILIKPQGPLSGEERVFEEEPGWRYHREWVPRGDYVVLAEVFLVSVRIESGITGDIRQNIPAAMSMSNLQAYSPALFERLASGYFSVKVPFSGMPFHREAQLALLNALTQLTPMAECEKVTVRNGRLVVKLSRDYEEHSVLPKGAPEAVVKRACLTLEALAVHWAELTK